MSTSPMQPAFRSSTVPDTTRAQFAPYARYVVGLLCVVNIVNYMDRTALSVLMPAIKVDLELTDGQLGLLVGFAFFLFYAICGIPIARWADRGIRTNIIVITLAVWSVMTALSGAAQNFWHLLAARVGLGAGEAGCIPSSQSLLADYVPVRHRSGVYAIFGFGTYAGGMIGLIVAGGLGDAIGWRWTLAALGLPGIALALLVRLTLREPIRGACEAVRETRQASPALRETVAVLWHCRTYRLLVLYYVIGGFATVGLMQWWPSFYERTFALSLSSIGIHLGLAIGVGAGVGTLFGGFLGNRLAQRDVRLPLMLGAVGIVLAVPVSVASLFVSSSLHSMLLVLSAACLWSVPAGPAGAALVSVVLPSLRATAGAVAIFCIAVLGFGLGPFCVGVLSDAWAPVFGAQALRYALLLPVCFFPPMACALYAAAKGLPGDLRAMGAQLEESD